MEDQLQELFFYPNACNVCQVYGKNVELKRCSGCKMIVYCDREHQKQHWLVHKEICRVLSDILRAKGKLYESRENMESKEVWLIAKTNLLNLVKMKLGRPLQHCETEMLQAPRSCEVCHETDPQKLSNCNDCPYASFCDKHPKDCKHSEKCRISKLCFETNYVFLKPDDYFELENNSDGIPKDMEQAIELYEPTYRFDKLFKPKKIWAVMLSDQISRVYTFLYTMEKLNLPRLEKMTVHVIGSNLIEMASAYYWQRVLHHVKHLRELNIIFVGPELKDDCKKMRSCNSYKVDGRRLSIEYVGDLYANFAADPSFTKPDYIIGFNLGIYISSPTNDTWAMSFKVLAKLGCPFCSTAICKLESKLDREWIDSTFGKKVPVLWAGKNPFSSWKPNRNVIMDEFFYSNHYLNIYKTLS